MPRNFQILTMFSLFKNESWKKRKKKDNKTYSDNLKSLDHNSPLVQ